jgi:para-aminobenzoate synthetase/4-amino-4-deoxychorismate lyase
MRHFKSVWRKPGVSSGPEVILESFADGNSRSWAFSGLVEEITAMAAAEVIPALQRLESWTENGYHAAGFVSYEASTGLENNLATHPPGNCPLLWFGIFRERRAVRDSLSSGPTDHPGYAITECELSLSPPDYCEAVDRVREYIASGDTYQVNFTLRQRFGFSGCEKAFYRDLCRSQRAPYCAFLDLGRYCILSASPELFFHLKDGTLTTRPMKGTAKRGRWTGEDEEILQKFRTNEKERAENLMIVDLLRNDMGIVSQTGSVQVASLFDVETLETVHQMTSTISSRLIPGTGVVDLFRALFPCGSVTGAPKRRTMEIIAELEDSPRSIYTGCIGHISPGPEAAFSVAIRTIFIDRAGGTGEMGLGSGITWDSDPRSEYQECLTKGRFARIKVPEFRLLESILFEEGAGWFLLERHMRRLSRSADYFGFTLDLSGARDALHDLSLSLRGSHKVRLLLCRDGSIGITSEPIPEVSEGGVVTVAFAETRVDSENVFLYHKTDNRAFYIAELAVRSDCADVIFLNERGEVTEGANNNIVARIGGELVTPPILSGLLPGTFREELLDSGMIMERKINREELEKAEELYLINSVRRWRKAVIP